MRNGRIDVKYCTFETNTAAISCGNLLEDTIIYGCRFTSYNLSGFHFTSSFISAGSDLEDAPTLTIARCEFSGTATDITGGGSHREIIFNKYINFNDTDANKELSRYVGSYNMYGNESYNSQTKFFVCHILTWILSIAEGTLSINRIWVPICKYNRLALATMSCQTTLDMAM